MKSLSLYLSLVLIVIATACSDGQTQVPPTSISVPNTPTLTPTTAPITATETPAPTPIPTPVIGSIQTSPADGMLMVYVPSGSFLMGLEDPDDLSKNHAFDLRPPEVVELEAYWIDKTEVTNGMYLGCVEAGECDPPIDVAFTTRTYYFGDANFSDYPVFGVSWDNATKYCQWVGRRLPTEAEWEKAARGWDGRLYPWGYKEPNCNLANYDACSQDTLLVGSLAAGASPYGTMDMAGNVWEWVADWYALEAYPTPFPLEGQDPVTETLHVVRGGSWAQDELLLQSGIRFIGWPIDEISVGFGFRCALDESGTTPVAPQPEDPAPTVSSEPTLLAINTVEDIDYATSLYPNPSTKKLNVYSPAEPGDWPVIIFAHGSTENRRSHARLCKSIAERGAVVFAISWPATSTSSAALSNGAGFRKMDEVIACAVAFARESAEIYGGASQEITLAGFSAGAGIGARVALAGEDINLLWDEFSDSRGGPPQQVECETPKASSQVTAFVGISGGYHTPDSLHEEDPALWDFLNASAISGMNPGLVIRLLHGEFDSLVPIQAAELFNATLIDAGYDSLLIPFDMGHAVPIELAIETILDAAGN